MASVSVKKKRRRSLSRREAIWAYILISPWLIGFIFLTAGPMIASALFSLTEYNVHNPPRFIGLTNWRLMFFDDPLFWHSLKVTLTYAAAAIPLGLTFGLALALLLNANVPGITVWRTLFYMPSVVSGVAVAVLWTYIFNPRFGIINWILSWFGIKGPAWLGSPDWALPALIIMSLWSVGGGMIIYLAGLQSIPTTLYEAAKIDGANTWQRFWRITLPLITPVIFYNLVTGIIGTFQYFTQAYVMTNPPGGPANATKVYNLYLYLNTFRYGRLGFGSAMAWFLLFIVLVLTMLVVRSSAMWVYYEGELKKE
jgi:multiple sugar transport system permease protein